MHFWQCLFLVSGFLVFYNYAGYVIPVWIINKLFASHGGAGASGGEEAWAAAVASQGAEQSGGAVPGEGVPVGAVPDGAWPTVSFIVAAYNEEACIVEKITNSLEQDYPAARIEFLFITDGSTDHTTELLSRYPLIRTLHQPERRGKSAAINRAVKEARHEILIFSDANALLNREASRKIARHYRDNRVGGVAGEKKVLPVPQIGQPVLEPGIEATQPDQPVPSAAAIGQPVPGAGPALIAPDEVGAGEGLYWKYESFLKRCDSAFYSVVGAAGELFSLRKNLYEELPDNIILDDFVLSLKVTQKGYRVLYEPEAFAMELPSFSLKDEQKRKVRIAAGGFQSIAILTPLLAFWRRPRLSYLYISHRVLRWAVSPLCLILAFISNGALLLYGAGPLWTALFIIQVAFYGSALLGRLLPPLQERFKLLKLCYYFVFMNTAVILGFFRFLRGRQSATWEKARRANAGLT
jgi:poly-beta-1,6-N-acetyl-D-glucosamine synthase